MKIGYIGLGKMGLAMAERLHEKGHQIIAWNRSPEPRKSAESLGIKTVENLDQMIKSLPGPRLIWLMLTAGQPTLDTAKYLAENLDTGDTVIDGANSFYKNTIELGKLFEAKNINFLDCGVSGGPHGARHGACLMIGGHLQDFQRLEPLFKDLAAPQAYQFFEGVGAGHFVKMVHNGIEYGMMQAIAEGFNLMKNSDYNLNLIDTARIYNQGSVIESRLVGWTQAGFEKYGEDLESISGTIKHSGEGEWTIQTAKEFGVPTPVIEQSLQFRIESEKKPSFTGQIVSMMRNMFGGHDVGR